MTADDPRLTAFALDALPTGERIQVQRALSENPSLETELDSIEEFSSRLGRAFRKSTATGLNEGQWAEILNIPNPQPTTLAPAAEMQPRLRSFSPWILPLAATLIAAAIVFSTMFYKPRSQPIEALKTTQTTQTDPELPLMVIPSAKHPETIPSVTISNPKSPKPTALQPKSVLLAQHPTPAFSQMTQNIAPVSPANDAANIIAEAKHSIAVAKEALGLSAETAPETLPSTPQAEPTPQPVVISAIPFGGSAPILTPNSIPTPVVEQPVPQQTVATPEKKSIASNSQNKPVGTTPPQKQAPSTTGETLLAQNNPSPKYAKVTPKSEQLLATNEPDNLAQYEGGLLGELPAQLIPESIEIVNENVAMVTLSNNSTTTNLGLTKTSGSAVASATPASSGFTSTSGRMLSVNALVYSDTGIVSNLLEGSFGDFLVLSISSPNTQSVLPSPSGEIVNSSLK